MMYRLPLVMGVGFGVAFVGLEVFNSLIVASIGVVVILVGLVMKWRKSDTDERWPNS